MGLLKNIFRKKPEAEKNILEKIKNKKAQDKKNFFGGDWISTSGGCYKIKYRKHGKVMELSNLQLVENMNENPEELEVLLKKAIGESKTAGCEVMVVKTWIFAVHPELRKFKFKEIKEGSEKDFLARVIAKRISSDKLIKLEAKDWYPTYYLELK